MNALSFILHYAKTLCIVTTTHIIIIVVILFIYLFIYACLVLCFYYIYLVLGAIIEVLLDWVTFESLQDFEFYNL